MSDAVGWMRFHIHGILMDLHGWPSRNAWETFKQLYHCWQAGFLGASFSGAFWFLQDMRHAASGGVGWLQFVVWSRHRYFGAFPQWRLRKKVFGRSVGSE